MTLGPLGIQVIPKSDLYRLILRSKLSLTEPFQDWITEWGWHAINRDGNPWFMAKDVCDILGTGTDNIPAILDSDKWKKVDPYTVGVKVNGPNRVTILNEPGLCSLVLRSRVPIA